MQKNFYRCENCGLSTPRLDVPTQRICNLLQWAVKDTDTCPHHVSTTWECECCGQTFPGQPHVLLTEEKDNVYVTDAVVCKQCYGSLNTCQTCQHGDVCAFKTDPSPIPPVINKTFQQDGMYMTTQVMNPDRINITCKNGCPCFVNNQCMMRSEGSCHAYKMRKRLMSS